MHRCSRAAHPSGAIWSSVWSAGARWETSTPRTIPSSTARSRSSCCTWPAASAPSSVEQKARLLREAQAIARLSHPNVVVVHDVGSFEDQVFVAMEFVDGHTVAYWQNAARRSWREVLDVFIAAGRGLSAAHAAQLVHRDFKGENVMITSSGQVRVMDFGLARNAAERSASRPDR